MVQNSMNSIASAVRLRRRVALWLPGLTLALSVTSAGAAHWPSFGGDAGRSGHQPFDSGGLPVPLHQEETDPAEANVKTSLLITESGQSVPRLIFGTSSGKIHHLRLDGGGSVVTDVDDDTRDTNIFTGVPAVGGSSSNPTVEGAVTPVETSAPRSPGLTFAVHNDDNQDGGTDDVRTGSDIALAVIDQTTGALLFDQAVGGTDPERSVDPARRGANTIHFETAASPVLSGVDANGTRNLFFMAVRQSASVDPSEFSCRPGASFEDPPDQSGLTGCSVPAASRLFKVALTDAGGVNVRFAPTDVSAVDVPNANPLASPTFVNLAGTTYLAVSTQDGAVRTYSASGLAPGPAVTGLGAEVYTPSAPVRSEGPLAEPTAVIYVGANTPRQSGAPTSSKVHQIVVGPAGEMSLGASSPALAGQAAPALAVTQQSQGAALTSGRVVYSTASNLYSLDTADLSRGAILHVAAGLSPGTTGFSRTTAAVSGGLLYIARDNGEQLVLDAQTLDRVRGDGAGFQASSTNVPAPNSGVGQPAVAQGFVGFGNQVGVFVYRNQTAPTVTLTEPADGTTSSRKITLTATAFNSRSGVTAVTFKVDGVVVGSDTTPDGGNAFSQDDPAVFSVPVDLARYGSGRFIVTAEAVDGDSAADRPAETGSSSPHTVTWLRGN